MELKNSFPVTFSALISDHFIEIHYFSTQILITSRAKLLFYYESAYI